MNQPLFIKGERYGILILEGMGITIIVCSKVKRSSAGVERKEMMQWENKDGKRWWYS